MGGITQDSGSSRKSFRGRIPINASDATRTIKQKISQFSEELSHKAESMKRSSSLQRNGRETSVYTKGVRQLNDHGFETFNIEDCGEIFISKVSNNALFNDGEPVLVRATDGNYVGRVDPFKAQVAADQPAQAAVSEMKLFQNVPRASSVEKQFSGVVGVVTSDGTVAVKPVDNGFLNKMARPAKADEAVEEAPVEIVEEASVAEPAPEHDMSDLMSRMVRPSRQTVEAPAEEVVEEAPAIEEAPVIEETSVIEEAPVMESVIEEIPAEEIVAEAPAEEPVKEHEEFFIDTEEAPVELVEEAEAEDTGAIETDDYSWVEFNEGEPAEAAVAEPFIEAAPAEEAVEEVVEAPVVETVETVVAEPAMGFVEAPAEEVVEETVEEIVEEAPVEAPSTGFVEAPAEEIPADVTPSLPGLAVVPEGLHVEGNEPSNAATSSLDAVTTVPEQTTATSAVALEQNSKRATLPRDGEALPPMSDPVIKRPNSMRFRFDNGVLMNVSSKSKGSEEGARSPLE